MRRMRQTVFLAIVAAPALWTGGCGEDGTGGSGPFGISVRFLTGDGVAAGVPPELIDPPDLQDPVSVILPTIVLADGTEQALEFFSVRSLVDPDYRSYRDMDGDGAGESIVQDARIPIDEPFSLKLTAHPAGALTPATWSARADGIVLRRGERRFMTIALTRIGRFTPAPESLTGTPEDFARFGATATTLTDGRVLIAGGFDVVQPFESVAQCRTYDPDVPDGAVCFLLTADRKAFVFVPHSARVYPIAQEMARQRAFHSTVALPGGRAAVVGGTDAAVMVFAPNAAGGYSVDIVPITIAPPDLVGMHDTFEIFDPTLNAIPGDPHRDGNPERGGFREPGTLGAPRFLSVAAVDPTIEHAGNRVLVAGGLGRAGLPRDPATTWDLIDGTSGTVTPGDASLANARTAAGIGFMNWTPIQPGLWIVGGAVGPDAPGDVIEKWSAPPATPNGRSEAVLAPGSAPERNLVLPLVVPLGSEAMMLLAAGSYGARCTTDGSGTETPSWTGDHVCPPSLAPPYTIGTRAGGPQVQTVSGWNILADNPHVFGAAAALGDGSALLVGGAADLGFVATRSVHRITELPAGGAGQKDVAFAETYPEEILLPAAATTRGGDAVFIGGLRIDLSAPAAELSSSIVLFNWE